MRQKWQLRTTDPARAARLVEGLSIHEVTARCLVGRGIEDPERAREFLQPRLGRLRPPSGLAGFRDTVTRLAQAIREGETIGVFGDYDVDGVTSVALMTGFLRDSGARGVVPRVADRERGYGFTEDDVNYFVGTPCKLIVTVDCGTSDIAAIASARARGLDVIVIDHHEVPTNDHPAIALLNPHRSDSSYPFRGLASVGLSFFVAAALQTELRTRCDSRLDVRSYLDLVAIGTVADQAPLREENRILVSAGLKCLATGRPGVKALLRRAGVEVATEPIGEKTIAWKLAPRLNAPGRLGSATPALNLLLCRSEEEAFSFAEECEHANVRRRERSEQMLGEALGEIGDVNGASPAIIVARRGWHPGVVGILAAKLAERFGKPAVAIALDDNGLGRGSVRSVSGVNVYDALAAVNAHLVRWGGHAEAAGLTIREECLPDFRMAFAPRVGAADELQDGLVVDALVPLGQVSDSLAYELGLLAPFGAGNPEPIVCASSRVRSTRHVGDGSHLKLTLECTRSGLRHSAIAFGMAAQDPGAGALVDVAFSPAISYYRGERRLQLEVHGLWHCGEQVGA